MKLPTSVQLIAGVSCGTIIFLAIVWFAGWLWQTAGEHDRNPPRGSVPKQLMNRKSSAMMDIFEGMIRGDLRRVNVAAKRLETYGNAMGWYISNNEYDQQGEEFRSSLDALQKAAGQRDFEAAKEAVLVLEKSCIECHMVMNREKAGTP